MSEPQWKSTLKKFTITTFCEQWGGKKRRVMIANHKLRFPFHFLTLVFPSPSFVHSLFILAFYIVETMLQHLQDGTIFRCIVDRHQTRVFISFIHSFLVFCYCYCYGLDNNSYLHQPINFFDYLLSLFLFLVLCFRYL